jgi:hypothetical protein
VPDEVAASHPHPAESCCDLFFNSARHRRWGGYELPRARYYAVMRDEKGPDDGTLVEEIRAYRDCAEQGMIVDVLNAVQLPRLHSLPDQIRAVLDACLVITIFPASRLREAAETTGSPEFNLPGQKEQLAWLTDEVLVDVLIMPPVEKAYIPNVVDLRLPQTRMNFFKLFQTGEKLNCKHAEFLKYAKFLKPEVSNISTFFGMLPQLAHWSLGGADQNISGVTQAIGRYLRAAGASGVVYPSARVDHGAEVLRGSLRRFGGWNFVDYRNCPSTMLNSLYPLNPWYQNSLKGIKYQSWDTGELEGSFVSHGVTEANWQLYEDSYGERRRSLLERLKQKPKAVVLMGTTNLDLLLRQARQ